MGWGEEIQLNRPKTENPIAGFPTTQILFTKDGGWRDAALCCFCISKKNNKRGRKTVGLVSYAFTSLTADTPPVRGDQTQSQGVSVDSR